MTLEGLKIKQVLTNNLFYLYTHSNKEGIMMFRDIIVAPGGGHENGSFTHTPAHKKELDGYNCTYDEYEVPVTTISALVEKYSISEIDLLSLDAEHHDSFN